MENPDSFNPDFSTAPAPALALAPTSAPVEAGALPSPVSSEHHAAPADAQIHQRVQDALHSDSGVSSLLARLKASIASARDFSSFLKRRGALEEEHAGSLKKLSRLTLDGLRKPEARHESYSAQYEQVLHVNERIADNGTQFGLTLHAMHENLQQLASKMDVSRKTWKQQGMAAETRVLDAEKLAEKAKGKYDQLAEDLDRVKTGDGGGRKFGLKKSAAQQEEELQRKTQAADQDYLSKVQAAQAARKDLLATTRPQAVAALLDLIKETDAALTMQMQKYASFSEMLVVKNGQVISPQPLQGSTAQPQPSVNQLIYQINNERDFDDYILEHASKNPTDRAELLYVKHPTQAPVQSYAASSPAQADARRSSMQLPNKPPPAFPMQQPPLQSNPVSQPLVQQPPAQAEPVQPTGYTAYSQPPQPVQPPQLAQVQPAPYNHSAYSPANQNNDPPQDYSRGPVGQPTAQQSTGVLYNNAQPPFNPASSPPPVNPVFGVSLEDLFQRDGSPVPLVVYQGIQAVDMYGLEVEGIYRIPGTSSHIQQMKAMFDSDASQVDFRNPEAFQHDVNSVAGLLKQFFRELPDSLLTQDFYTQFIDAARIDDDTMRRDSMHALINALPDPNYATLRALALHLHRVQQASEVNRMSTANLGICWAPSIMGPHKGNNMADAGLQARVIITILDSVLQIFDED